MTSHIDIKEGKKTSKRRFILHIISVSILSILVIGGSISSLLLSTLDYNWNLILNIVIWAIYLIFITFYFINIFPVVYHYYSLFKNMNEVTIEKRRHLTYVGEIENRTQSNVVYRVLQFSYKEGENEFVDNLYLLDSEYQFESNKAYRLQTFRNVIIRSEELSDATV